MRGDGDGWVLDPDGSRYWGARRGRVAAAGTATGRRDRRTVAAPGRMVASGRHVGAARRGRDSHESAIDTAIREADEEAGIGGHELRVLSAFVTHNAPSGWTYTTVIAEVDEPVRTVANGESTELRWVDITDVEHMPLHPAFGRSWPRLKDHLTTAARQQS